MSDTRERLKQRAEAALARAKKFDMVCPPLAASEREFAADLESVLDETVPPVDNMRSPDSPCWAAIVEACGHDVALSDAVGKAVLPFLAKSTPPPAGKEAAEEDPSLCTVTIKKDGDDFVATDSETESDGYGKSYPDALVALAGEMGKVGEGCLGIMEDWAREEIEAMGKHVLEEQCPQCGGSGTVARIDETVPSADKEAAKLIALLKKADPGGSGPCEIGRGDLADLIRFLEGLGSVAMHGDVMSNHRMPQWEHPLVPGKLYDLDYEDKALPEEPRQTPTLQAKTEICPDCGEIHKLVTCPDCGGNSFACLDCLKKTYEALSDPVKNSDG